MHTSPISVEALLVLDAIEHRGSYAAAAEQLNKVPSALSYIVQKLEEQLSVTLFVREGRRAVLTPAGKHLLSEGRKVLFAINTLSEQTQTIANGWEPKIRIAYDSILDISPIFQGIERFLAEHASIELDIQEEVLNGTWEALIEDRVDLVIGAAAPVPSQKGISAVKIAELNSALVVGKSHTLAKQLKTIDPTKIAEYRNIVVHDSSQQTIPWSVNLIEGTRKFFVSSIPAKISAIIAGIGIGYLPKEMAQRYVESGELVILEEAVKPATQDLFMAWKITNKGMGLNKLKAILSKQYNVV